MTMTRGRTLSLTVMLACLLVDFASSAAVPPAATTGVRLKAISARVSSRGASLVIEATEPVPYVATRPDPLTLVLDFRNVGADGLANSIMPNARSPIASVAVEPAESMGARVSRVRIALAQPVAHHVRSERNTVVVDFDRMSDRQPLYVMPAVSRNTPDAMLALQAASVSSAALRAQGLASTTPPLVVAPTAAATQPAPSVQAVSAARLAALPPAAPAVAQQRALGAVPTQQPPPAAPAQTTPQGNEQRRYTGHPVSMQFEGLDLRAVLRLFAEISGLNVVIDPTVQGSVDVALTEVPWDQALDLILRANKLGYVIDGTIVRIAPLTVLADEESQRRRLSDEQALAGELRVLTKSLSYAKAQDLVALLTKSALSPRGTVQVDPRTNTLIITDLRERIQPSLDLIVALDKPQPQVEIEARIVQTNRVYARALGIQWGATGAATQALGNTTNLAFPNSVVVNGAAPGAPPGTAVNLPALAATSGIGLALGSVNGAFNLDVALSALENTGKVRLLSTPRVSTQNNVVAEIKQGVKIGYQIGGTANVPPTTTFIDAVLSLRVTPQISNAGTVIMQIAVVNDQPGIPVGGIPQINTQAATTTVQVTDGETTVIGGIYASAENLTTDTTPGLSKIPVLKWLFRRESVDDKKTELIIFITPRIIKVEQG
jgi:type IV pilus secretin PilQ/predicted competence protein